MWVLVLVLAFGPGGVERYVVDYGLTQEECRTALTETPPPYKPRLGGSIEYRCEPD